MNKIKNKKMFPIRCFTCGSVVAKFENKYNEEIKNGTSPKDALDKLKINRICCRRMFLGYIDIDDELLLFSNYKDSFQEKNFDDAKKNNF